MKVHIDVSIFSSDGKARGRVYGVMELAEAPSIGDEISVLFPGYENISIPDIAGFSGNFTVSSRTFSPVGSELPALISLSLDDVVVPDESDAKKLMIYLEDGFFLGVDFY